MHQALKYRPRTVVGIGDFTRQVPSHLNTGIKKRYHNVPKHPKTCGDSVSVYRFVIHNYEPIYLPVSLTSYFTRSLYRLPNVPGCKTSVSETIRKVSLAEAQTALGKLKYVPWKAVFVPLSKFCEKLLPHIKFH